MQKTSERLGKLVKETRISRNLTQLELAELLDKSERTVIKIEKGEGNPKLDSLAQIVKVLKPDLEVLFDPAPPFFGGAGSASCIWLFAQRYFQLYYVDSGFFSAFGAVEREVQ